MVASATTTPQRTRPRNWTLDVDAEPILVDRFQAARLFTVGPCKFDEWFAAGLIVKWKLAGMVRYTVDELRRIVAAAEFRIYQAAEAERSRDRRQNTAQREEARHNGT